MIYRVKPPLCRGRGSISFFSLAFFRFGFSVNAYSPSQDKVVNPNDANQLKAQIEGAELVGGCAGHTGTGYYPSYLSQILDPFLSRLRSPNLLAQTSLDPSKTLQQRVVATGYKLKVRDILELSEDPENIEQINDTKQFEMLKQTKDRNKLVPCPFHPLSDAASEKATTTNDNSLKIVHDLNRPQITSSQSPKSTSPP